MRAGFIPARPERKERNMAVPASKRARAMLPTGCRSETRPVINVPKLRVFDG